MTSSGQEYLWRITVPGEDFSLTTDDFTLDEIEAIEAQTDVPWIVLNPSRFKVARAMLIATMLRSGMSDEDVTLKLKTWTVADLNGAFIAELRQRPGTAGGDSGKAGVPPTSASS
jgi:hypothetical protein